MLIENAKVIAIKSDRLWLKVVKQTACGGCKAQSNCGNGMIEKWFARPVFIPVMLNASDACSQYHLNQSVQVGVQESAFVKAALMVYFLPCLFMVLGVLLGSLLSDLLLDPAVATQYRDLMSVLGGMLGLMLMAVLSRSQAFFAKQKNRFSDSLQDQGQDILGVGPVILKPMDAQPVIIREV